MSQLLSLGRGGAGNIVDASKSPKLDPKDLETPTLKTSVVTTGRGGSGNMAKNTDPVGTRALQDVQPIIRRESQEATYAGRGGAGNVLSADDARRAAEAQRGGSAVTDAELQQEKGWAEKGKDLLFGKKH